MRESNDGIYADLPELFTASEWDAVGEVLDLSQRHQQVARLVCLGWSIDRMAESLDLDPDATRRHIQSLFRHLRVRDAVGVPVRLMVALRELEQTA